MRDFRLPSEESAVLELGPKREDPVRGSDGENQGFLRDARDAAVQEYGGVKGLKKGSGAGEEEVADAAVGEVEPLGGVAHYLRVEVDQEGAYRVLVRCRYPLP